MIELRQDQAVSFRWYDANGLRPTSLTAQLYDRADGLIASASVVLPTGSTTIKSIGNDHIVVNSAAGFSPGDAIRIISDGVTYVRELGRIEIGAGDPRFHLVTEIPEELEADDPVVALTVAITFAAVSAPYGDGYRVKVSASDATSTVKAELGAAVVRWTWQQCSSQDVAAVLAAVYQDERSEFFCRHVAARVNAKIEHALDSTGRRPWLYSGGSNLFSEVIQAGIRYVLADHGIAPAGDYVSLLREMRFAFDDSLRVVVAGLRDYDDANTGETVPGRPLYSIPTVR